jgi:hypothetical protein
MSAAPYISLYLPISPYISLYILLSPYISAYISLYLGRRGISAAHAAVAEMAP